MNQTIQQICQRVASRLNLKQELVETVIVELFAWLRHSLKEATHNKVLLNNFGTFSIMPKRLKKRLESSRTSDKDKLILQNILKKINDNE